ncbi:hypothetical protein K488DRAFT_67237 [Vararia minispora EC-137]|uniref:Uncharacterized protein n=1 Tax=Vararia minispora EC-137 TaxID=1314806 RepID=A0ACB8QZ94_9AGAM|nr:hypothetical protein K488DRAFT_67237 [Vararia minispora EC-137]
MSKKRHVPAALHSELSDYASLLRVLRTNSSLDVASQLAKLPPADLNEDTHEPDPFTSEPSRPTYSISERSAHSERKGKDRGREQNKREMVPEELPTRSRDNWTRWPLLPNEVHPTEWGFQEEVRSLAQQALDFRTAFSVPSPCAAEASVQPHEPSDSDHYAPDLDSLSRPTLRVLTEVSSIHLERMLSSLVSFAPAAHQAFESRFGGIGWETVLEAVCAAGLFDVAIVDSVQRRLERMYGPAEIDHAERVDHDASNHKELDEFEAQFEYLCSPYEKATDEDIKDEGKRSPSGLGERSKRGRPRRLPEGNPGDNDEDESEDLS